ncbi:MAG: exo-beta-N-acetylmuramidase NamZ family protein [Flavobacteriaceae bacterium]
MKRGRFKLNLLFKNTLLFILFFQLSNSVFSQEIIQGAERVDYYFNKLNDKKIAIIANNTSVIKTSKGSTHIIDTLIARGLSINKIFSPEHGFLGDKDDGEKFENDFYNNIEIISLYGGNRRLKDEDIEDIDIIIFDIQDVGVRFYTYLSTLHYAMQSAARKNKKFIIMDRANPNSFYIDGPVLDLKNSSFIGLHPVPIVYGMTIGEYGLMINGEGWLENNLKVDLEVIKLKNYNHKLKYEPPIRPSPNLPNIQSIYLYPSLAFLEKTEVSVGRGTTIQFQIYGHPDFKGDFSFTPQPNFGSQYPKLKGVLSYGEDLRNYKTSNMIELKWLINSFTQINDKNNFFRSDFDKLSGTSNLKKQIIEGLSESEIRDSWKEGLEKFKKIRKKYLLY